jgi:hypothetical protein
MSLFLTDFDAWYDEYAAVSPRQQHDRLKDILSQLIDPTYAKEVDLGMLVIELQDMLLDHNQLPEALALVDQLQQQQPTFYQQEFQYFDGFLVQYYLYCNDLPKVTAILTRFKANSEQSIDHLIEIVEDLQLYGAIEPLLDLCRAVYRTIESSRKIMPGTGIEFARVIFIDVLENVYDRVKQGETVDWEAVSEQVSPYDFDLTTAMQVELEHHLTSDLVVNPAFLNQFSDDRQAALRHLLFKFCRYMYDQYQMSFVCAQMIWSSIVDFWEQRNLSKKQSITPDAYFTIDSKQLEQYVVRQITGFLSVQQSKGFAILWGIPYVYELLLSTHIIDAKTYDKAIATTNSLKPQLTKSFPRSLWQYSFVHRWQRANCLGANDFQAEAAQFTATFTQSTPLSEQPIDRGMFGTGLGQMTKSLNSPSQESPMPNLTLPTWKPAKPRKSALQEASELQAKSKNDKSAKSKRKGFG